ncbi:MAG: hypothetical protein GVY04_10730 [Cyanobacteria bacterium]|jgi:hypothetical protein|nr:hypothetical protein [Cyanobacteria bacterium GSL.Bin1]
MKQHPFTLSDQELKTNGIDPLTRTTEALNEIGRSDVEVTTLAIGEEGGDMPLELIEVPRSPGGSGEELTTLAIGEEGGDMPLELIEVPRSPGGSGEELTTLAIGEEGGDFSGEIAPLGGQGSDNHPFFHNPVID